MKHLALKVRIYPTQKQAHLKQLRKLERKLVRKQKGPKNREKARIKFARLEHIRTKRARAINARIHKLYEEIKREGKNGTDKTD